MSTGSPFGSGSVAVAETPGWLASMGVQMPQPSMDERLAMGGYVAAVRRVATVAVVKMVAVVRRVVSVVRSRGTSRGFRARSRSSVRARASGDDGPSDEPPAAGGRHASSVAAFAVGVAL